MKYKLEYVNDYSLIVLDEKIVLIDTGCPNSVSFNPNFKNIFDINIPYGINPVSLDGQMLSFGKPIDGIIGRDILSKYHNVMINIKDNYVELDVEIPENEKSIDFKISNNYPMFSVKINGVDYPGFFDSGAHYIMFKNRYVKSNEKIGSIKEATMFGITTLDEYSLDFTFNGNTCRKNGLDISNLIYYDWIYFGINAIADEYVIIDNLNQKLVYK